MQRRLCRGSNKVIFHITKKIYLNVGQKTVKEEPKKPGEQVFNKKELKKRTTDMTAHI
jgi:hypothetical protein